MRETWINRSGGKAVNLLDEQIALFPEISDFELCQKIANYRDTKTNKSMERLTTGDWIFYDFKGAYTQVCESPFNGFPHPDRLYCASERVWQVLQEKSPTEVNNNYEKL
ncbi:unnamed protein product, partial [Mesorhabditis spiculigera]